MVKTLNNLLTCNLQSRFGNAGKIHFHDTGRQNQMFKKSSRTNVKCMPVSTIVVKYGMHSKMNLIFVINLVNLN